MKLSRQVSLFLIVTACASVTPTTRAQVAPATTPPSTTDTTPIPTSDVPQLTQTLFDPAAKQEQRDVAAKRLLVRPGDEARAAIRKALIEVAQPNAQLAAARALAEIPTADPALINPLFALMEAGARKEVIDSAAMALGSFKNNADVLTRLLTIARDGTDMNVRLAAIAGAGTFVEKRVAQTLLNLMDPTAQPPAINLAAERALAYMVGLDAETTTGDDWRAWWRDNSDKPDQQFKADLVQSRANRYDAARQQITELETEVVRMIQDQYLKSPADQRPEVLSRALRAIQPAIRSAGARITANAVVAGDFVSPAVKESLRAAIGDADASVRRQVALALALINDADAIVPLLTQLNQEPDSTVRAAIAQAVAPIRDPRSVEPLLKLLDDPRVETAQAAAVALSEVELGRRLRAADAALADRTAERLMTTLQERTTPQNESDLRADLARAVGAMQSPAQGTSISRLLQSPAEVPKVRRALLWAAGQLKLPELADPVAQSLSDPDAGVRLAAIKALGQTATNFDHQRQLSELLDPVGQPATEIGDAAWAVLSELFKLAPNPQLVPYAVRFKAPAKAEPTIVRDTAARRLVVLRILRDRAKGANDAEELAGYEQQIGDAAIDAQRYDEAISSLRNALQIAIQRSNGPREELVSDALMKALLRGRKFTEAITFYQTQARRDLRFQGSLSAAIRQEAERLYSDTKDLDAAKQLIAMALASTPPLPDNQREMLENLEKTINNRTREQNQTPRYPKLPVNASIN